MPFSMARSMMRCASGSSVTGPKFIVPRTSRETDRPLRPRCVYSMAPNLRRPARASSACVGAGAERRRVVVARVVAGDAAAAAGPVDEAADPAGREVADGAPRHGEHQPLATEGEGAGVADEAARRLEI